MRLSGFSRLAWALLIAASAAAQSSAQSSSFPKWTALNSAYLYSVAGDSAGNVYVASETSPGTVNTKYYVSKVAADGSITYQTQINLIGALAAGDSGSVWVLGVGKVDAQGNLTALSVNGDAIASDATGQVYLAKETAAGIAVTKQDIFGNVVATWNTGILASVRALAVDGAGAVYLTGEAYSSFVATPGALQTTNLTVDQDREPSGFAAKLGPGLDKVMYATLLGGTTGALCLSIAVDSSGGAIIGGSGQIDSGYSNNVPFPITQVGLPLLDPTDWDAFVVKLSADGSRLVYSLGLGFGAVGSLAVGADGTVHAAGMIGESPGLPVPTFLSASEPSASFYTAGLFSIDSQGSVLREQHLAPVPCCQSAAPWFGVNVPNIYLLAGVTVASDASPRLVTMIGSQQIPPTYMDQVPTPYVIDAPVSPPVADISVTAAPAQTLIGQPGNLTTLDFTVTVTNAGPSDAEGIHIVIPSTNWILSNSNIVPYPRECIPGAGTICYEPGYAVINRLAAGESASIEFFYSCEEQIASPANFTVPIEVFAATFDPNPKNNEFVLTVPFVTGHSLQFGIDPSNLVFYRSDIPGQGPCAVCWAADSHLSVWAPTPQTTSDGNTWYFDSWTDGVTENPRVFDASRPLPSLQIKFLPSSPVSIAPASLDFVAVPGTAPPQRSVVVGALNAESAFSVGVPADPWLSVSATFQGYNAYSGITKVVTGSVSTAGLAPGYYTSSIPITLSTNGANGQTIQVPVSLRIMDQVPAIDSGGVVNAGSYAGESVSGGEMISIFGSGLGPPQAAVAPVPQTGSLPTTLGGTRVLVSGTNVEGVAVGPSPMQLLFVQDGQISAIVNSPGSISDFHSISVQVEVGGVPGPTVSEGFVANAPGLFTSDASGRGSLAAVNSDGTVNSPSNPAKRGTYVSLYATGFSWTVPDGLFGPGNFGVNLLAPAAGIVEALIGTEPADVEYAGVAPAIVSAAQQINVLIPADSQTGPSVPIRIGMLDTYSTTLAWVWTQDGVTIAIR
jgi:uncharacterized protein (TIGR03437 family)